MPPANTFWLPYEASDFPAPHEGLNGQKGLRVTWDDLIWATITVGKSSADLGRHGRHSLAEMVHRVACFEAYFKIEHRRLTTTTAHKYLDPTEKGLVSYYLGMAAAKIYADKVLNVAWLMHISRYEAVWAVKYGANSNRPDLFGFNPSGDWLVAEAKGRTRINDALLSKMRDQKSAVASVNGAQPMHRIGTTTRFRSGTLSLRVVDPPASELADDLEINPAAWLADYYRPLVDLFAEGRRLQEGDLTLARIPGTDIEVGLSSEALDTMTTFRDRNYARPGPSPRRENRRIEERNRPLFEQAAEEDREAVRYLTASVSDARDRWEAQPDGLIIRARAQR